MSSGPININPININQRLFGGGKNDSQFINYNLPLVAFDHMWFISRHSLFYLQQHDFS